MTKYLVQCKCGTWLLAALPTTLPATETIRRRCSSCERVKVLDFSHVLGQVEPQVNLRQADEFAADEIRLTKNAPPCLKGRVDADGNEERFVVMSTGKRFNCFSGVLITRDISGILEHIGIYSGGKCVRGLWCHQASHFLQYHSTSSSLIYSRGMISGLPVTVSGYDGGAVATNLTFEKLLERLLNRFELPAMVKRRRRVHEHPSIDSMN